MTDLHYDGQTLRWMGYVFRATPGRGEGLHERQDPCLSDSGPIPEGTYRLVLAADRNYAQGDTTDSCSLRPAQQLQQIPGGDLAVPSASKSRLANWGHRRVRLEPADASTRSKCSGRRSAFCLHDSSMRYSHGCIEVEGAFFNVFISVLTSRPRKDPQKWLTLTVRYRSAAKQP